MNKRAPHFKVDKSIHSVDPSGMKSTNTGAQYERDFKPVIKSTNTGAQYEWDFKPVIKSTNTGAQYEWDFKAGVPLTDYKRIGGSAVGGSIG